MPHRELLHGKIGVALGMGAARGWAHVGVIRGLRQRGIHPEIVAGCSAGALVGAFYAADRLDVLERWARRLDRRTVMGLMDVSLRGGLIQAQRLFEALAPLLPDTDIGSLPRRFAVVATDLETGQEVWLRDGPLHAALRASMAIPGFVAPVRLGERWLVDGGLVNPVPVSLCRALGADSVIGVDLTTSLLGRRFRGGLPTAAAAQGQTTEDAVVAAAVASAAISLPAAPSGTSSLPGLATLLQLLGDLRQRLRSSEQPSPAVPRPSLFESLANSMDIAAVRITRSRMAGDPPELIVTPRVGHVSMFEFERVAEAIDEGLRAVARVLPERADAAGAG